MNEQTLLQRKAAIEQRYDELKKNETEVITEIRRLEGEHRLILDLLTKPVAEKPKRIRKVTVEDDATTE